MRTLLITIICLLMLRGCEYPAFSQEVPKNGIYAQIKPIVGACQDPETLTPELKKAYYELKKASQELGGFSVSIKCYPKES